MKPLTSANIYYEPKIKNNTIIISDFYISKAFAFYFRENVV